MSEELPLVALVTGAAAETLSAARDISESLERQGFVVTTIDEDDDLVARLIATRPEIVFNNAVRTNDGRLQAACGLLGLPHTHSGLATSALATDRHLSKMVFKSAGIPVTDHVLVNRAEAARDHVMAPPYIVKARHAGTGDKPIIVRHAEDLPPAALLGEDWEQSEEVLVERFLPGITLLAFIMGDVMIGIAETTDATKNNDSETLIPASISPKITRMAHDWPSRRMRFSGAVA